MIIRLRNLAAVLLLSIAADAFASSGNAGGSTADFLRLGAGARALGMGEAFGPVAEGAEAIYWNPAGLAQLARPELEYSHVEMLQSFHHDFAAYAHPVPALSGTIAAAGTIFYQDSLDLVTNTNQHVGTFKPNSEAVALAYSRSFSFDGESAGDRRYSHQRGNIAWVDDTPSLESRDSGGQSVMTGLAVKYIRESLADKFASAFAVDGGLLYRPPSLSALRVGAQFRNLGSKEKFIQDAESLPAEAGIGASYLARWDRNTLLSALEIDAPFYGDISAKAGAEYSIPVNDAATVSLRAGYKTLTSSSLGVLSGITVGTGVRYRSLSFDFGFEPMAQLGEVYRLSFNFRF